MKRTKTPASIAFMQWVLIVIGVAAATSLLISFDASFHGWMR